MVKFLSEEKIDWNSVEENKLTNKKRTEALWKNPIYREKMKLKTRGWVRGKKRNTSFGLIVSRRMRGKSSNMKGKHHSIETKKLISQKLNQPEINKKFRSSLKLTYSHKELRDRMSKLNNGKKLNHLTTEQMSQNTKNSWANSTVRKRIMKGKTTFDVVQKLREARLKQILPTYDTKPERIIQQQLNKLGVEFVKQKPMNKLVQADIYIPESNTVIFADGCYWHGCSKHSNLNLTKETDCNIYFYQLSRDKEITEQLNQQGYKVIRIWEHDIVKSDFDIRDYV